MKKGLAFTAAIFVLFSVFSQSRFEAVILGCGGGLEDHNLSAYLVGETNKGEFLCLDAGTLYSGIKLATSKQSFPWYEPFEGDSVHVESQILKDHIKAYLISHAHIDHVSGLVIASPDDVSKPLLGLSSTIENIINHLFNWKIWPNFGNEGTGFVLGKYQYQRLEENKETQVPGTSFFVTAFPLSHSYSYQSTAFLIRNNNSYLLYCGDTGADEIEGSKHLDFVWATIAPLVQNKSLQAILLECSYPNHQPIDILYGHLTPALMLQELGKLALKVNNSNPKDALAGLTVVVTHIKPSVECGYDTKKIIARELESGNDLGLRFVIPEQGERIIF